MFHRFGRYPHRNVLLNRASTPEEEEYLKGPLPSWARSVGVYNSPSNNLTKPSTFNQELPSHPSISSSRRKPSVLVLHSSKQNPVSFIKATRKVFGEDNSTALGYHCKISVLPATHSYTPIGEAKDSLEGIENPTSKFNRCWWNATDDPSTMIYEGLEETIAYVNRYCLLHGPFDGIVGFSQGGCLAGILAYLQQIKSPLVKDCNFQFVVIISGFACRDVRSEFNMSSRPPIPINIPSFHSWGLADTLVINSRSECLANWFVDPVIKTHVGGHFFGAISLWPIPQIIEWIQSLHILHAEIDIASNGSELLCPTGTFDEKYDVTKSKNDFLFSSSYNYTSKNYQSNKKRLDIQLLKPYGLSFPEIIQHPFWLELVKFVPIHDTLQFTQETVNTFLHDLFQGYEINSLEQFESFIADLILLSFCLYPYPEYAPYQERTRSKQHRLTVQGEVFYWFFLRVMQYILESYPYQYSNNSNAIELIRFYLDKLLEIGDWNDIFRLDLLICSGTSVKIIKSDPPIADIPTQESSLVIPKKSEMILTSNNLIIHDIIINLIVSRLCLDIQILKSKSHKDTSGTSTAEDMTLIEKNEYDELVHKKLELSLENDQYYLLNQQYQRISDCVKYCPRLKSYTEKSTGLTSLIAYRLYHRMNNSGLVTNDDLNEINKQEEDHTSSGVTASYLIHIPPVCRNYYRYVLRQLSDYHTSLTMLSKDHLSLIKSKESNKWKIKAYATCTEEEYQELLQSIPLSTAILHPEPEPVDVATSEEMSQLYQFFQSQYDEYQTLQHNNLIKGSLLPVHDQIFNKGTLCSDGRLDLCKQVVGPNGITSLINSLILDSTGKHQVQHLLLGNNICGNGLGEAVGTFIKSGKSKLTTWYIAGNRLTDEGIYPVCLALQNDYQVTQLWLKRNPLHATGARHISDMLRLNSTLLVLDLVNTGLLDEGGYQIISALSSSKELKYNTTLQHLYLDGNGFTISFAHEIAKYFLTISPSSSSSLITLSLGCNRFGDEGVKLICSSLYKNLTLQRLCLASVGMGSAGGHAVATLLKYNTTLRHLDLGLLKFTAAAGEIPNRIGTNGAIAIAHSLKYYNKTLFSLLLLNNNIFQAGMSAIRAALLESSSSSSSSSTENESRQGLEISSTAQDSPTALPPPTSSSLLSNEEPAPIQFMNQTLIRLELEQMGVPFNELTREEIRLALRRNYLLLTEDQKNIANEAINPHHLSPIQSVYRVNGSYTK